MLTEGTILQGRYRIVRQLGQGGMGAVYEAVDERLDTVVALKETFFADEKLRKQFEREARLLARLHHQALPRVSDHFNEGDGQFLVMQYVAGEDLAAMLAQSNGPFPEEEVLRWADQLCDALDYLHTQDPQIIHRDIKPQNLKLTARGQIVLLDFGLAKGSVGQMTAVTTSASIYGYTPNYAPLEQIQGKGTDPRSDIYALGATLFHLLTNLKPADALSRAAAVVNGQPDPLPLANQVRPDVSAGTAHVLAKSLAQRRDDRFVNATAMREALRSGDVDAPVANAPTLVAAFGSNYRSASTVANEPATRLIGDQTQRASSPSFSSEAKTLVAGEATNVRTVSGGDAATVARPAAKRSMMPWIAAAILLMLVGGGALGFYAYRNRQAQNSAGQPEPTNSPEQAAQPTNTASPSLQANNPNPNPNPDEKSKAAKSASAEKSRSQSSTLSATSKPEQKAESIPPAVPRPEDPAHDPNHDPNRDPNRARDSNGFPRQGDFDPFRGQPRPTPGAQGHPPNIRTMRNGTRVIRNPDGSFVMILPNGETRVITPPKKPNKNPNQNPNQNKP
jgi:eukaryotic-like serine/threonine-protein kinase